MKAIWNGSISFGLVNMPIKLYSAVEHQAFKMRLLHKEKLSPIRYRRWCDECKEEVAWKDITKGVEVGKNKYVVLNEKELESIKPEKSQRIEIVEFVDSEELNPIYFDSHYYAGPAKAKEKTFSLFQEVLAQTKKVAIGQFVMRSKEYVCAITAHKEGLLVTTLNYAYEIRDIEKIEDLKEKPKLSKQEIDLANQLIDKFYAEKFDIDKFKDTFAEGMKEIVRRKTKGEKIKITKPEKLKVTEKNLVEALKASL